MHFIDTILERLEPIRILLDWVIAVFILIMAPPLIYIALTTGPWYYLLLAAGCALPITLAYKDARR